MAHRVLVVEDDAKIRQILQAYLGADGFEVAEAATGADALNALRRPTDLVLLDIGLPDMDGLTVLQKVRATSDVPVILVTARTEEVDKLVGLSVGADDYVTKPFSPREVVARVRTVLRRARSAPAAAPECDVLRFPGLEIDLARREVRTPAGQATLSSLDFDLLVALATDPRRVFSRAQLLEKVWGYDFYGDERIVDVHVRTIRAALGDDATAPALIGTVRGVGYKFLPSAVEA